MFSQESQSVITSCGQSAFAYAAYRGLFDLVNTILEYKNDIHLWTSAYTHSTLSHKHPLKVCSAEHKNFWLLIYLLQLGADPNIGLMKEYKCFTKLSTDAQLKHHWRYRFASSPLNILVGNHDYGERAQRLFTINCLLYYGANPNIPGVWYTPLHAFMENFGTINEDIIPTVHMMVLCRLDMRSEQWLIDRLQPGVPLGSPPLRQWLLRNVKQPMPLFNRCIVAIRTHLAPRTHWTVESLPLPKQLKGYVLLEHIFKPQLVSSSGTLER